ncbi:MAG: type I glyceraldehyde-3-phosphate dehydrogenase [Rickettsiales bacterium]|nr:type I glyceraldehyde-3-phosphate dehydrogenase [Rickettsiales bacterium]
MTVKIAINGLGRIGRCVLRAVIEERMDDIEVVAVNGPAPTETHLQLLKYDSVHGRFNGEIAYDVDNDTLDMGRGAFPVFHSRNPAELPWGDLGVDVVMECTGVFKSVDDCQVHLNQGAKKVLISAPASGDCTTVVYGVNNDAVRADDHVLSVGSCTTNCLAPVAHVLNDAVGINSGYMTTIHAYTGDQNIVDSSHKDLRRARAAAMSMVPTSTGAAKAIGLVLPELAGKLQGSAIRVPTPNVSLVDLTFVADRDTNAEAINKALKAAASGSLKGVLGINEEPLVSIDFCHRSESSIADLTQTKVVGDRLVHISSWYDNEWGFSCRMLDMAKLVTA